MLKIITSLLNLCFPPSPEARLVATAHETQHYKHLYSPHRCENVTALTRYGDPLTQALIKQNKFHHDKNASIILGQLLERWIEEALKGKPALIMPIPLSRARHRARGYNQVEAVAQTLQRSSRLKIRSDLLTRCRDTVPQTSLSKKERLHNMRNAFQYNSTALPLPETTVLLLIDDVVTTGATLEAGRAGRAPPTSPTIRSCVWRWLIK